MQTARAWYVIWAFVPALAAGPSAVLPTAQAQGTATPVQFHPTGALPKGAVLRGIDATKAARDATASAREAKMEEHALPWITLARIDALGDTIGSPGSDIDAFDAVRTRFGEEGVLDLKRLILSATAKQKLIPAPALSTGPGALFVDTNGLEGREDPTKWVSTIYHTFGDAACTATLIGPRVLLTAAHCLERAGPYAIDVNGKTIALHCTQHPSYAAAGTRVLFDYGLCYLAAEYPTQVAVQPRIKPEQMLAAIARVPAEIKFGMPAKSAQLPAKLAAIEQALASTEARRIDPLALLAEQLLDVSQRERTGTQLVDLSAQCLHDVILAELAREAGATVTVDGIAALVPVRFERLSLSLRDGGFRHDDPHARRILLSGYGCTTRQGQGGNDNILRAGEGRVSQFGFMWIAIGSSSRGDSAILCSGDSGGAAYRVLDGDVYGRRVVIAVNAQNIDGAYGIENVSFVAKTAAPAFRSFFAAWRQMWGFPQVCGIDQEIDARCHD